MLRRPGFSSAADLGEGAEPGSSGADLRLVPATVAAWTAVWWATAQDAHAVAVALSLVSMIAAGVLLVLVAGGAAFRAGDGRRSRLVAAVLLVLALTALHLGSVCVRLKHHQADPLIGWASQGLSATVTGRVSADPTPIASRFERAGQRWVLHLSLRSVSARAMVRNGSGTVVVMGGAPYATLSAGQQVRIRGRLASAKPGDAALALISPRSGPVVLSPGNRIWRSANALRAGLRRACAGLNSDAGGLLPALVVGDTSALPPKLATDLRAAGLTHLTAVSGANLAILATAVSAFLALAGARIRTRALCAAASIAGFVILARPEPSVLRAAVMAALALIAAISARPGKGLPLLCATALILLLADPWLARSFGFALSVLATAGLLVFVPAWLRKAGGRRDREPKVWRQLLVAPIAVPLAALISTAPVTVLLQPQLSAVAVPANLLAEPAVPIATLLGVLAAILSAFWPWGAALAAHGGGLATRWIAAVAHSGAAVPGAQIAWLPGVRGAVLLTVLLLVVAVLSLRPPSRPVHLARHSKALPERAASALIARAPQPRWGVLGVGALGLAAAIAVLGLLSGRAGLIWLPGGAGPAGRIPHDWLIVQCDVGQGSATLINTGQGRAIMVDTGPDPALASRCLRRQHIRSLDLIMITHFHADHAGGLSGVLPQAGHPPILVSPLARPSDQARAVQAVATRAGSAVITGHEGLTGVSGIADQAAGWRLLYPPVDRAAQLQLPGTGSRAADDDGTQINDSSLAMLVTVHNVRILLLGDLETDAQQSLLASLGRVDPVDVVVVAHHGSARQYPPLYAQLHPRAALIGVGRDNDYGHPAPSAISMLQRLGARTLRTDTQGQLTVAGTADHLRTFGAR